MNSKNAICFTLVLLVGLAASPAALADSVIVNGTTYNCTNTCVVTLTSPNIYKIHDCCGGKVSWKEK